MEINEELKAIGQRAEAIRQAKGLKQSEVAKSIGLSTSNISNMERGNIAITLRTLFKLKNFYGCEVSDFFYDRRKGTNTPDSIEERTRLSDLELIAAVVKTLMDKNRR